MKIVDSKRTFYAEDEEKVIKEFSDVYMSHLNDFKIAMTSFRTFSAQTFKDVESFTSEKTDIANSLMEVVQERYNKIVPFLAFEKNFSEKTKNLKKDYSNLLTGFVKNKKHKEQIAKIINDGTNRVVIPNPFSPFRKDSNE